MKLHINPDPNLARIEVITRNAICSAFNSVVYSTWDTLAAHSDMLRNCPPQVMYPTLIQTVKTSLVHFAAPFGIHMTPDMEYIWSLSIATFLLPKVKDGSIFHKADNIRLMDISDMPKGLFESMAIRFDPQNIAPDRFAALTNAR